LILPATLLSSVLLLRAVDQLFAWRVSPHANLLAQAALAAFVIKSLGDANFSAGRLSRAERVSGALGCGCLALAALLGTSREAALLALGLSLLPLAAPRLRSWLAVNVEPSARLQCVIFALLCAVFLVVILGKVLHLGRRSDLLSGRDPDVDGLCGWLAHSTPKTRSCSRRPTKKTCAFVASAPSS
jgi:hypothetical protein